MAESALTGSHDGQKQCPLCQTWIQRTEHGTLADGMAEHSRQIHKTGTVPA